MNQSRENIVAVIKEAVIPKLRNMRFRGSFPHFRRLDTNQTDLLTFQFSKYGGEFCVEVAVGPSASFKTYWGKEIEPKKLTAHDLGERLRIGPNSKDGEDHWFTYEGKDSVTVEKLIEDLTQSIDKEAVDYWRNTKYIAQPDGADNSG
ncbi:DUF4304 domain-containing protein [Puniceicoccus vermicola]|uniref:DUF4304 domain-containing protein n=1 Tax=Puniceicoccus vermicola TaxID=388746 RepID=A0A7X1AVC8_9BACT|nr:DUF4304 domain-containing protein [Puniceicoccus vermicola]MBC2600642.1 DUF4304 domain-containing protein [Puniceicoccus vermicola]